MHLLLKLILETLEQAFMACLAGLPACVSNDIEHKGLYSMCTCQPLGYSYSTLDMAWPLH